MKLLLCALLALAFLWIPVSAHSELVPGSLDMHWSEGSTDCAKHPQPPIEVHRYNAQTFILRESLCATYEAPFMYLLVGSSKALLIDTGDVADASQMPLAKTVMGLLPDIGAAKMPLIVAHTHGHLDHRAGDPQFTQLPNVQVVPTDLEHVRQYFGFADWPHGLAQVDLGNRTVDVLPTPGHYPSHVSYYDRTTGLFFSGDFFLPGRLFIADTDADKASAQRVADFIRDRPVSAVLGGHVELDADGNTFDWGSNYHPHEHALPMTKSDLLGLPAVVATFDGFYNQDGVFVMLNQMRVLVAEAVVFLVALGGIGWLVWGYLRRRRRRGAR